MNQKQDWQQELALSVVRATLRRLKKNDIEHCNLKDIERRAIDVINRYEVQLFDNINAATKIGGQVLAELVVVSFFSFAARLIMVEAGYLQKPSAPLVWVVDSIPELKPKERTDASQTNI